MGKKKSEIFVWKKKIELNLSKGCFDDISLKVSKKRKRERTTEIENLKKKRQERAIFKAKLEDEKRERARVEFQDFEKIEREFLFRQLQIKSDIRLEKGRGKPIDVLMNRFEDDIFDRLAVDELEELRDDIKLHLEFDTKHVTYWQSVLVVCEWELDGRKTSSDKIAGLHPSVAKDVHELLQKKTHSQLQALQSQTELRMQSGAAKVVEFFEAVLRYLPLYKAKACLKEMCWYGGTGSKEAVDQVEANLEGKRNDDQKVELESVEEGDHVEVLGPSNEIDCLDKFLVKPKYFNRVHIGYDWNRYNRIHYDRENPPPKMVRGYKFNIYYPDLVNKSKSPSYMAENDGGSSETCIIRFSAGSPYQDIAFRIVNREWDYSRNNGFKCTFERGTLCLHFNFKRCAYRR